MDILAIFLSLLPIISISLFIRIKEGRSTSSFISEQLLKLRIQQSLVPLHRSLDDLQEQNSQRYVLPKGLSVIIRHEHTLFKEMDVFCLGKADATTTVLYFHGGAYVEQPLLAHWIFLERLIRMTDCQIIVPLYPKAPAHQVTSVMPILLDLYKCLENRNIIVMGDSAGGGLALSMTQVLAQRKRPLPQQLILISPWLDISLTNRATDYLQKRDPMLDANMLRIYGDAWRGSVSAQDPLVSPLYGSLKDLCPMMLFVGTHELFLGDARLLKQRAKQDGAILEYHEGRKMNHDYILFPIPEAARARLLIAQRIGGKS